MIVVMTLLRFPSSFFCLLSFAAEEKQDMREYAWETGGCGETGLESTILGY